MQKGFDIKIFAERGNINLHVLQKIWVSSFLTMIRVRVSNLPIGVKKFACPIWIRISESPTPSID